MVWLTQSHRLHRFHYIPVTKPTRPTMRLHKEMILDKLAWLPLSIICWKRFIFIKLLKSWTDGPTNWQTVPLALVVVVVVVVVAVARLNPPFLSILHSRKMEMLLLLSAGILPLRSLPHRHFAHLRRSIGIAGQVFWRANCFLVHLKSSTVPDR